MEDDLSFVGGAVVVRDQLVIGKDDDSVSAVVVMRRRITLVAVVDKAVVSVECLVLDVANALDFTVAVVGVGGDSYIVRESVVA